MLLWTTPCRNNRLKPSLVLGRDLDPDTRTHTRKLARPTIGENPQQNSPASINPIATLGHVRKTGDAAAPKLLIVGRSRWMTARLQQQCCQHPEGVQRLVWITDASDEYLRELYPRCHGLLSASSAKVCGGPDLPYGRRQLAMDPAQAIGVLNLRVALVVD